MGSPGVRNSLGDFRAVLEALERVLGRPGDVLEVLGGILEAPSSNYMEVPMDFLFFLLMVLEPPRPLNLIKWRDRKARL